MEAVNTLSPEDRGAAIVAADPAVLRMALLEEKRVPQLEAMRPISHPVRGGAMFVAALSPNDAQIVRAVAADRLDGSGGTADTVSSHSYPLEEMLAMAGEPIVGADDRRMAADELNWTDGIAPETADVIPPAVAADNLVVIVGAGISGIAAATRLKALGLPIVVIERSDAIGGTWRWNNYPGARVDVPTPVYQFQDERHDWQRPFARQGEILDYLKAVTQRRLSPDDIQFGTELVGASWDDERAVWQLNLHRAGGRTEVLEARFVISAVGLFNRAKLPEIDGLEAFDGPVLHTTGWDPTVNLTGLRVALIGTGSSGAQLLPELAAVASQTVVFQRTPNWVMPLPAFDAEYPAALRILKAQLPTYERWGRHAFLKVDRQIEPLQELDPAWIAAGGRINRRNDALASHLTKYVRERFAGRPDLISASLPAYAPASRRLVVDNGWYDALLRPHVTVVTQPISRIDCRQIVTADGSRHDVDALVVASGFAVDEYLFPVDYVGRGRTPLSTLWQADGARAFLGLTMPGFPNMIAFYGPNGQPRSGGFHAWADRWARYAAQLIVHTLKTGRRSFDVKIDRFAAYNRGLDLAMEPLVWGRDSAGSYYLNNHGRSAINMPWRAAQYFAMIDQPDWSAYDLR